MVWKPMRGTIFFSFEGFGKTSKIKSQRISFWLWQQIHRNSLRQASASGNFPVERWRLWVSLTWRILTTAGPARTFRPVRFTTGLGVERHQMHPTMAPNPDSGVASKVCTSPMGQTKKTSKKNPKAENLRQTPYQKQHFFPWLYTRSTAKVRWFQVFHSTILQISCCQGRQEEGNLGPSKVPTCQILLVSQAWWVWIATGPKPCGLSKLLLPIFRRNLFGDFEWKTFALWVKNLKSSPLEALVLEG